MQTNERREALADFLRKRRTSLSPSEVGLPPGLRRRTPGLRREEVAQLANIGTSWYVWLEQGRDVHPSAQVLESLVQALRLTPNERRKTPINPRDCVKRTCGGSHQPNTPNVSSLPSALLLGIFSHAVIVCVPGNTVPLCWSDFRPGVRSPE